LRELQRFFIKCFAASGKENFILKRAYLRRTGKSIAFKTRRKERIQKNVFNDEQHKWWDFSPSRVDDA
jgi:hypothetical protein|tara:strand:- start:225 stop:428 length:204 start_codon:yes stop_codon:yes gene_type:complete